MALPCVLRHIYPAWVFLGVSYFFFFSFLLLTRTSVSSTI